MQQMKKPLRNEASIASKQSKSNTPNNIKRVPDWNEAVSSSVRFPTLSPTKHHAPVPLPSVDKGESKTRTLRLPSPSKTHAPTRPSSGHETQLVFSSFTPVSHRTLDEYKHQKSREENWVWSWSKEDATLKSYQAHKDPHCPLGIATAFNISQELGKHSGPLAEKLEAPLHDSGQRRIQEPTVRSSCYDGRKSDDELCCTLPDDSPVIQPGSSTKIGLDQVKNGIKTQSPHSGQSKEDSCSGGTGKITFESASDSNGIDFQIVKNILLREGHISSAKQLVISIAKLEVADSSMCEALANNLLNELNQIRELGVQIVEKIVNWRQALAVANGCDRGKLQFIWRNENFLSRILHDLDFLQPLLSNTVKTQVPFRFCSNPFVSPITVRKWKERLAVSERSATDSKANTMVSHKNAFTDPTMPTHVGGIDFERIVQCTEILLQEEDRFRSNLEAEQETARKHSEEAAIHFSQHSNTTQNMLPSSAANRSPPKQKLAHSGKKGRHKKEPQLVPASENILGLPRIRRMDEDLKGAKQQILQLEEETMIVSEQVVALEYSITRMTTSQQINMGHRELEKMRDRLKKQKHEIWERKNEFLEKQKVRDFEVRQLKKKEQCKIRAISVKHQRETAAAIRIQCHARGFINRRRVKRKRERETTAACKIQSVYRGQITRKKVKRIRFVSSLQTVVRGYIEKGLRLVIRTRYEQLLTKWRLMKRLEFAYVMAKFWWHESILGVASKAYVLSRVAHAERLTTLRHQMTRAAAYSVSKRTVGDILVPRALAEAILLLKLAQKARTCIAEDFVSHRMTQAIHLALTHIVEQRQKHLRTVLATAHTSLGIIMTSASKSQVARELARRHEIQRSGECSEQVYAANLGEPNCHCSCRNSISMTKLKELVTLYAEAAVSSPVILLAESINRRRVSVKCLQTLTNNFAEEHVNHAIKRLAHLTIYVRECKLFSTRLVAQVIDLSLASVTSSVNDKQQSEKCLLSVGVGRSVSRQTSQQVVSAIVREAVRNICRPLGRSELHMALSIMRISRQVAEAIVQEGRSRVVKRNKKSNRHNPMEEETVFIHVASPEKLRKEAAFQFVTFVLSRAMST